MIASSERQKFEQLLVQVAPHASLLRAWPLTGGISATMTALEVRHTAGHIMNMIVRHPGGDAQTEYNLLQRIHSLGVAVPAPLYLDLSGTIFPTPYLVIEYVEGQPQFAPTKIDDFAMQLAVHLARIHRVTPPQLAGISLPAPSSELIRQPDRLDHSLDEGRIRAALESIDTILHQNPPVLLHGDYWPGNILWQDEKLAAVIDWEDACLGDPIIDLAIARLDLLWIIGPDAMTAFTYHYQSLMALDDTYLSYWDLHAALRLIRLAGAKLSEWAAFFHPFGRHDITEQSIRDHFRYFITQAFENR